VELPALATAVLAGAGGLERPITWAHAIEVPDPGQWLAGGELVMTVGIGLPADAAGQDRYVRRLHDAGAAGLALGQTDFLPEISPALLAAADALDFPVLLTAYEVPFVALAQAVAAGAAGALHARLAGTQRLYDVVRAAAQEGLDGAGLLARLGDVAGCRVDVVELPRGTSAFGPHLDEAVRARLLGEVARFDGRLPAVTRLGDPDAGEVALPLRAGRPAVLLAAARCGRPDVGLLQHVAHLAALELEKLLGERERTRRLGAELLDALLDDRLDGREAAERLDAHGLGPEPRVLAALPPATGDGDLHHRLSARGVAHLLAWRTDGLYVLAPGAPEALAVLEEELSPAGAVGFSAPLGRPARVADAAREARLAQHTAASTGSRAVVYGSGAAPGLLLPRSLSEADALVAEVLGPLLAYDATHASALRLSLEAFLEHNRSWLRAAERLHVHKQTLVYRMRRVEELTGRRLDTTDGVAELWLALRALRALGR
jgi:purine catabolism regulator